MPLSAQKSGNFPGSFMRSVTGLARNAHVGPDIQVAAAMIKRVGLGSPIADTLSGFPFSYANSEVHPTGPLAWAAGFKNTGSFPFLWTNTTVDPLYLSATYKIVWNDVPGSTYTMQLTYDPVYQDMTQVITDFSGSVTTNSHITAQWNQNWVNFSMTPSISIPPGYAYGGPGGTGTTYSQSASATLGTMAFTNYSITTGGTTTNYYGATITITLSNPHYWADFCNDVITNILSTLTLGNNITQYSGSQLTSGTSAFGWTWIKNIPSYAPGGPTGSNLTNSILGVISRANGVQVQPCQQIRGYLSTSAGTTSNRVGFNFHTFTGVSPMPVTYNIIEAYGAPTNDLFLDLDVNNNIVTSAELAPYILCVSSCVRNNTAMGVNFKTVTYDPSTNTSSFAWSTQGGLPSTKSQTTFSSGGFGNYGINTCPFAQASSVAPLVWDYANYPVHQSAFEPFAVADATFGSPVTFYCCSQDSFGNMIETIPATWSLINMTGSVVSGDLVPSADTRSAVLSLAHHGSCQVQCVSGPMTGVSLTITV